MKRIKSAPANIAEMVNRKKPTSEKSSEKIILIIPKPEEPEKENTYNDFSKQIVHLKNQKIIEKTFNSIMIDYINDKQVLNSNDEEALILSILYYYFCEKIFTKNNLREFIRFITQTLIKYVFAHMLNDVLINNKDILIQQITHINHL